MEEQQNSSADMTFLVTAAGRPRSSGRHLVYTVDTDEPTILQNFELVLAHLNLHQQIIHQYCGVSGRRNEDGLTLHPLVPQPHPSCLGFAAEGAPGFGENHDGLQGHHLLLSKDHLCRSGGCFSWRFVVVNGCYFSMFWLILNQPQNTFVVLVHRMFVESIDISLTFLRDKGGWVIKRSVGFQVLFDFRCFSRVLGLLETYDSDLTCGVLKHQWIQSTLNDAKPASILDFRYWFTWTAFLRREDCWICL